MGLVKKMMPARMIDFYANVKCREIYKLGGGFKCVFFSPLPAKMIQFDEHIFQMGWFNHHLANVYPLIYIVFLHLTLLAGASTARTLPRGRL